MLCGRGGLLLKIVMYACRHMSSSGVEWQSVEINESSIVFSAICSSEDLIHEDLHFDTTQDSYMIALRIRRRGLNYQV